ncbi:thioesterase II family protein [Saccharothrix longispora]|uniref:Surfactin synthase thioesterase subunit n=1 Tax=Saccharothrix longispora TaxID=33920 RepID=A0ABU1PS69_9PSEU|nr:alpha/beta fold hydrolase [Saccharothrix longispora]MDR6593426.1 surfactin synthase thioesterase subunit [Saccharothrix longispora]
MFDDMGPWLRRLSTPAAPRLRLVCLPHGGAGPSVFTPWAEHVPRDVELLAVRYPGREDRWGEPPPRDLREVVARVVAALRPLPELPFVLFGHSLGAAVAHEVVQRLRAVGRPLPVRLVVSGREAPQDERGGDVHRLGDAGLLAELRRLGGVDPAVLADPDLSALVAECVREDYRLVETHTGWSTTPLPVPVSAFVGDRDPDLTPDDAARWAALTTAGFRLRVFPGDHFYLSAQPDRVAAEVLADL